MKKAVGVFVLLAFALSLGVGTSIMFPQKAVADQCVDIPGTISVNTGVPCYPNYPSKKVVGVIIKVYDGRYVGSGLPCLYLSEYCMVIKQPAAPNID